MWDELNRWWLGHRKARPQPPDQLAVDSPPDSGSEPQPSRVLDVAESENSFAARQSGDASQTVNTGDPIQESECVEAVLDAPDLGEPTRDQSSADPAPEPGVELEVLPHLDSELGFPFFPTDEPGAELVELPGLGLDEGFPADWKDSEATLAGPFGGLPTRPRGRRLTSPELEKLATLTPQQRLDVLDCWQRSGLPAKDFAPLVGVSRHTLYAWKQRFERLGASGFLDQPHGAKKGSRLPDSTRRAILALKESQPDWGCERISNTLLRSSALPPSPAAVARVLHEAGYQLHESPTRPHPDHPRRFERARPNQLWQTDLFTFVLKRQNRRVYLVAFLDDHSRFLVSFGLHASQSTALVLEVFRAGVAAYGAPAEVLTDNGAQYVTWRGESAFHKELKQRGIEHIVARPRHPQTLGKIERFWGTLWRECLETAVFLDLADARADRPFHRLVQLPAGSLGHRWAGAGRPILPRCSGGGAHAQGAGGQKRLGTGAPGRAQAAILPDWPGWRPELQRACRRGASVPHSSGEAASRGRPRAAGSSRARCRGTGIGPEPDAADSLPGRFSQDDVRSRSAMQKPI